jgi:hypothetical protein
MIVSVEETNCLLRIGVLPLRLAPGKEGTGRDLAGRAREAQQLRHPSVRVLLAYWSTRGSGRTMGVCLPPWQRMDARVCHTSCWGVWRNTWSVMHPVRY